MSLFKCRDWWEVNMNERDSFDCQCMISLTLEGEEFECILTGSHGGFLRVFSPSSTIVDGRLTSTYQPSHLLLELNLSAPILQIKEGVLVSGSEKRQVAVLHSRLLSVYAIKRTGTKDSHVGDQVTTELVYQHVLRHSAHSFVVGSFGGVRGRHFISVLSLDGLLSFYEQESFAFHVYLPNFLLSFGFTYLDKTDSFLFLNGFLTFDCYAYQTLASAAKDKKIIKSWEYQIGEAVLDVQTVSKASLVILILSERNLWALNENGCLLFAKRLEYTAVAFCSYVTDEDKKLIIVVATDGEYIHLYEETQLKWSMKIGQRPVCLKRVFLDRLPGGLALLSEDGFLQCVYVGTHPSVYIASPLPEPELDFRQAESELKHLQKKINTNECITSLVEDHIDVRVNVNKTFATQNPNRGCHVLVEVNVPSFADTLQIAIAVECPLIATNPITFFTHFSGRAFAESVVHMEGTETPSSAVIRVVVTWVSGEGVANCIVKKDLLPLGLFVSETPPAKEAAHKFNLSITKPLVPITLLFKDLASDGSQLNAIAVKYLNSQDIVTVLAAKSSQRYRIQSDSLPASALLLITLVDRLRQHFKKTVDFHITHVSPLPLDAYYETLKAHHHLLARSRHLQDMLLKECRQYRTIQKKILRGFKDAAPKSSSNFHKLLADTSATISFRLDQLEDTEKEAAASRSRLTSFNRLLAILICLANIRQENLHLIQAFFDPPLRDVDDQPWLDAQEATASFLLRSVLAKSPRDDDAHRPKDTTNCIKHIVMVTEKFLKGTSLPRASPRLLTNPTGELSSYDVIPVGTKFATFTEDAETNPKTQGESPKTEVLQEKPTIDEGDILKESKTAKETEMEEKKEAAGAEGDDDDDDDDDDSIWNLNMGQNRL